MKFTKVLFSILLTIVSLQIYGQAITVDDSRTSNNLVNLLVGNSCAAISNVQISSSQSVAYFNKNGSAFPINEGILIRSGIAKHTQGTYTGANLDSQVNTNSDTDLQQISNNSGQVAQITDVAFLEFNFVPPSTSFSFNFLFSSNEYGEWQCGFSDVFAFILTDLTTGEKVNLAVVPTSGNPISIKEIRDNQYNNSCSSVNPELFGSYNVDNPAASSINMRGHTVVMNASATIKPNNPYSIKLVIGDYNDSKYDSAVFIEAGSFGNFLDLGNDISICNGETVTLDSGFTNTTDFEYEWRKDMVMVPGGIGPKIDVNSPGTYELTIVNKTTMCVITDEIVVSGIVINDPPDLTECNIGPTTTYDLTKNNITTLGLDPAIYSIEYFDTLDNLNNNIPIDSSLLTNYQSTGGVTIYGRITNIVSSDSCTETISFELSTNAINATKPSDFTVCENDVIDLPNRANSQILNGLNPNDHSITFFTTEQNALNNINAIPNPTSFSVNIGATTTQIWARLSENTGNQCSGVTDFTINATPNPPVDQLDNVYACASYMLQPLTNGNYFTGPNGTGTQLNAGDTIDNTVNLFIYSEVDGCASQTSFTITMIEEYDIPLEYCGEFIVPNPDVGNFFSAPNGPNGTGSIIAPGTIITSNQTIYYYADLNGVNCTDTQFDIVVHPLPIIDSLPDVTTCLTYTLPAISNGNYYTESGGLGTALNIGDPITSTQTIYIFDRDSNNCSNESSFEITIIDTSVYVDTTVCGNYTIPTTDIGNFFTESLGAGTQFNAGDIITSTQTIYFYADTDNGCADDLPMIITVNPLPPVDSSSDIVTCINSPYVLPTLANGNYFTQSSGLGTSLNPGDLITSSQRVFIYNFDGTCPNESSFFCRSKTFTYFK